MPSHYWGRVEQKVTIMSGLLALLDDVAAIVKLTATQVDDIASQAAKASAKVAGVVVDDAAAVSYTHLRAHETKANLVCRLLLEKKKYP